MIEKRNNLETLLAYHGVSRIACCDYVAVCVLNYGSVSNIPESVLAEVKSITTDVMACFVRPMAGCKAFVVTM